MSHAEMIERITKLEAEVTRLKMYIKHENDSTQPWWKKISGTFANDPMFEEAMRLGREYRESTRPKPRGRGKQKNARSRH